MHRLERTLGHLTPACTPISTSTSTFTSSSHVTGAVTPFSTSSGTSSVPVPYRTVHTTIYHTGIRLSKKVAIITGSASGIGRATAELFAAEGVAGILLVDRDEQGLKGTIDLITSTGFQNVSSIVGDVSSEEFNTRIIQTCIERYHGLDIYVANAGVVGRPEASWADLSAADFDRTFSVNVTGCFLGIKSAAKWLVDNSRPGSIICTASVAGLRSGAGGVDYSASKAAVINMVSSMSWSLLGTGIRVNAVAPGLVETGMTKPLFAAARQRGTEHKIGQLNPTRRAGESEEIATAILFLASDESSYVNGQTLPVCGGLSASLPIVAPPTRNRSDQVMNDVAKEAVGVRS